jgi:16S rRNA processing protein RimM
MKTQGRRGEVAVELHTDVPGRFVTGMKLLALAENGSRQELAVEDLWPHKASLILKFAGIDSISAAEALVGCELQVPREQRAELEEGFSYISDLVGCAVFDSGRELGQIADVRFGAGEAPLLIVRAGKQEYEIPYAAAYLKSVDLGRRRIRMELPEGLLAVNAPLTAEEKQAQKKTRG